MSKHAKKTKNEETGKDEVKKNKMAVYYSTVCNEEHNSKSEVQDVSDLYAAVDKSAKTKKQSAMTEMAEHYSMVCNMEEPDKSEVQDVPDLYAAVDKSAKRKKKFPEEITPPYATVD